MKKILLIPVVLLSFLLELTAQNYYNDMYFTAEEILHQRELRSMNKKKDDVKEVKASQSYLVLYNKKGEKKDSFLSVKRVYDKNDNTTTQEMYDRKGELSWKTIFTYNEEGQSTGYHSFKKDKPWMKTVYAYKDNGLQTREDHYFKDMDELLTQYTWTYNDRNQLVRKDYIAKKPQRNQYWVYEYYQNGSRKMVNAYNSKGKLESSVSYECKEEGQTEAEIKKDTSKVCIRYEDDGKGNTIKVVESVQPGKRPGRIITKFNRFGFLLETIVYNHKGQKTSHSMATYDDEDRLSSWVVYKKKSDEIERRYVYSYTDGQYRSTTSYRGDMVESVSYTFNEYY